MKKISAILSTLFVILLAVSCTSKNRVKVLSADYPELRYLEPGEFDEKLSWKWNLNENPYNSYACGVGVQDGTLTVNNTGRSQKSYTEGFDGGYFLGVDYGEFDGWVRYYPYYSTYPETGDSQMVVEENCRSIVKLDLQTGLLLTAQSGGILVEHTEDYGSIFLLQFDSTTLKWSWEKVAKTHGAPRVICEACDEKGWYIATDYELVFLTADYKATTLISGSLISKIGANSIINLDGKIWCGSPMGIYCFDMHTQSEVWYPMDYARYVK